MAVVCILLLAGCTGGWTIFEDDLAVDGSELEANAEMVDSYHFEVTRTLQSTHVNETTTSDGVVDAEERRAHVTTTAEVEASTEPRVTEQYVDGDAQYTNGDDDWERVTGGDWNDTDLLTSATASLEGATFEQVREETVNGVETTMFEVDMTEEAESELLGTDGSGHVPTSVEEYVYYVLVDTETDTLYGTDLRMEISQGGEPAFVTIETTFSAYGEDVDVSLPDDVREAASDVED